MASEVRPKGQTIESGTMGLAFEFKGIACSIYFDLIGLLIDIVERKIKALVDSSASYNFESKALVNHLKLKS